MHTPPTQVKTGNLLGGLESPKFTSPQLAPPSPSFAGFTRQQSRVASPAPGAQVIQAWQAFQALPTFRTLHHFGKQLYRHVMFRFANFFEHRVDPCDYKLSSFTPKQTFQVRPLPMQATICCTPIEAFLFSPTCYPSVWSSHTLFLVPLIFLCPSYDPM